MQDTRDSQFQPLGVCNRLFNFIMNGIIGRGRKRVTLGRPLPRGSIEVPVEGSSSSNGLGSIEEIHIDSTKPHEEEMLQLHSGNEIFVEFKHNDGVEYWTTHINNLGSSVNGIDKKEPLLSSNQTQLHKGIGDYKEREKREHYGAIGGKEIPNLIQENDHVSNKGTSTYQVEAKGSQDDAKEKQVLSTSIGEQANIPKKSVKSKKAGRNQEEKNMKKEKYKATERLTPELESEENNLAPPTPRHHRPLLSVLPDIDEKSDVFIREKIEAMRRNYSNK